jgi:capsular exopolysaccharide synthesis family protein
LLYIAHHFKEKNDHYFQSVKSKTNSLIDAGDLKSAWKIFSKNWIILLASQVLSYLFAYIYTYDLEYVYSASSQILIKSNDTYDANNTITQGTGVMMYAGYFDYTQNYNAIRVFKSHDLISDALSNLNLDVAYFIIGRFKTTEVFSDLPFKVKVENIRPELYEAPIFLNILSFDKYEISYKLGQKEFKHVYKFGESALSTNFNMLVTLNPVVTPKNLFLVQNSKYKFLVHHPNYMIQRVKQSLNCEIPQYTGIIQVMYEDNIPERAVIVLDSLCNVFINYSLRSKLQINERTIEYINKQLDELEKIIQELQGQLQAYRENKAILNLGKEEEIFFNQIIEAEEIKKKLQINIEAYNGVLKMIIDRPDNGETPPLFFLPDDEFYLKKALESIYEVQERIFVERNKKQMSIVELKNLEKDLQYKKEKLIQYAQNAKSDILKQIEKLDINIKKYEGEIWEIPTRQRELLNIQRQLEINQKMYEYLLERKANTKIARAGIVPESKIIESARSNGIVRPNKFRITFTFMGVGLAISVILVFVITLFFEKVESINELKEKTSLTVLGDVLYMNESKGAQSENSIFGFNPKSPIMESFRIIRTNLQYQVTQPNPCRVYLLTSKNPGEGKTFCSINLSVILARSGKKVLLLEFDLHKPRIGAAFNYTAETGISDILIGKNKTADCIVQSPIPNLSLLLCGSIPPNASELILSDYINDIFSYGREKFDYVIIDTPPFSILSDAVELIKHCDVAVNVINSRFPYRDSLNMFHEMSTINSNPKYALILNKVRMGKFGYFLGKYGYGYGYGYGYSYGYGNKS